MEQRIVFKNLDGSCGVVIPALKALEVMTIEEIAQKDVPAGLEWRICTTADIPADRTFRNAWTDDNPTATVDVDIVKARDIHMNKLRELRAEKFVEMGFPFRLDPAVENAIVPQDVRNKLKALRDMPANSNAGINAITTPEELKAFMPAELL